MSGAPLSINCLIAVWKEKYIRQFMELSLRSLLAPGNLPALAANAELTFTFLTHSRDRDIFRAHPMFARLEQTCRVTFVDIDDLIYGANYSATLTIAYERGMRETGEKMLSTYFIYLVADYIMANGSLKNLLPYMQQGVSGITAGNYQAVEEEAEAGILRRIDSQSGILAIPPRELVGMTLFHLHPLARANLVNEGHRHTSHTNRLFWRVNDQTLIGRFYLRHMLAIKPEIDNYMIGASCDYSFIPEMCPSGNVVHLSDSDEYCVVELQPKNHERHFIRWGKTRQKQLVKSLSKWATDPHRNNALAPVIFHSMDIPPQAQEMLTQSRHYVEQIEKELPAYSPPVFGHPYWVSCIEAQLAQLSRRVNTKSFFAHGMLGGIAGSPIFEPVLGGSKDDFLFLKTRREYFGGSLRERVLYLLRELSGGEAESKWWHREYGHSGAIHTAFNRTAAESHAVLVIAGGPSGYIDRAKTFFRERLTCYHAALFPTYDTEHVQSLGATQAIVLLKAGQLALLKDVLIKLSECLEGERHVRLILSRSYFSRRDRLGIRIPQIAEMLDGISAQLQSVYAISNPIRPFIDWYYMKSVTIVLRKAPWRGFILMRILALFVIGLCTLGYAIGNLFTRIGGSLAKHPTCAILDIKLSGLSPKPE